MPPVTDTVAAPLLPPLHDTLVCDDNVDVNTVGCVINTVFVIEHPFTSFTVHVYPVAVNPVAVEAVPPDGTHE